MHEWKRDENYYFCDGNIILLVSHTLFKVHESLIARDGSIFEHMFSSRGFVKDNQEGSADDKPVVLQGDTAQQFRDLLWSIYALPGEIMVMPSCAFDLIRVSNVAAMANKYHFTTTETWALQALISYLHLHPLSSAVPTSTLSLITETALLCDCSQLLMASRTRWKRLIGESTDVAECIITLERLHITDLLGLAYYSMMSKGRKAWDSAALLTRDHRVRLLSGFYNIREVCSGLPGNAPEFLHEPSCSDEAECAYYWGVLWNGMMRPDDDLLPLYNFLEVDKHDLLGVLMMAVSFLQAMVSRDTEELYDSNFEFLRSDCLSKALQETREMSGKYQERMMEFIFTDVI